MELCLEPARRSRGVASAAAALAVACLVSSAAADRIPDFNREIRPILSHNCFACHGPDEHDRRGGLRLDDRDAALAELDSAATAIVPGRGEAMKGAANVDKALDYTKRWVETLYRCGQEAVAQKLDLKGAMAHTRTRMDPIFGHVFIYEHCLPFDVSRAFDEASGIKNPRIWTAERDQEMWASLQT